MRAGIAIASAALMALALGARAEAGTGDDREQWRSGPGTEVDWGVGLRGRFVTIPRGVLELFVDEASSGVYQPGGGVEVIRRRGGFEMVIGVEADMLSPQDGLWLDRGDQPPEEAPDLVEFDDFGWVTADITAIWHEPLHDRFAIRYGAGLGVGLLYGDILRTDTECTGADTSTCEPIGEDGEGRYREAEDLPPLVPVVSAVFGAQYRPTEWLSWNLEAGIRSVAYAGTSIGLFF